MGAELPIPSDEDFWGLFFTKYKKKSFGQSIFFLFRGENVRWLHCPALEKGVYKKWLPLFMSGLRFLSDEFLGDFMFSLGQGSIESFVIHGDKT